MTRDDLCFMSAFKLASSVRSKQISPLEICQSVIARIELLEPTLNAFSTLTADRAMDQAKNLEVKMSRGEDIGPLGGVPVTIKDLTVTAGIPTERGSYITESCIPDTDAPMVSRLKNAGAIIIGKTTTSEFGWKAVSHSPLTGITHNPWGHGLNAGASSAGAGVGAAAGYGPLHQGSDGAGSIRIPAHFCGIYGLKPSFGRVPNWPIPNTDQASHIGPMTRTVKDAAMMLNVLSGAHPWDQYSLEGPPVDYPTLLGQGINGLRVAFSPDLGHARVDPEISSLVVAAATTFEELGCHVDQPKLPPEVKDGPELIRFFWAVHENAGYARYLPEWESKMDPGFVACIRAGEGYSAVNYMNFRARKLLYNEAWHKFFEKYDLLLTPAVSVPAFPANKLMPDHWPEHEWEWINWAEFSYPFNFTGQPSASIPCGFTQNNLPVGLQIVGPRFNDLQVLQASAAFEEARPWSDRRPPLDI